MNPLTAYPNEGIDVREIRTSSGPRCFVASVDFINPNATEAKVIYRVFCLPRYTAQQAIDRIKERLQEPLVQDIIKESFKRINIEPKA